MKNFEAGQTVWVVETVAGGNKPDLEPGRDCVVLGQFSTLYLVSWRGNRYTVAAKNIKEI